MTVPCTCCPLGGCFTVNGDPAQPVSRFRCNGFVQFYDMSGNLVSPGDVRPCGQADNHVQLTDLAFQPIFFGDGPDALGENLCQFTTDPNVLGNWTVQPGGCFDPASPSGATNLGWSGVPPMASLTFQYGNPPRSSGGAGIVVSSTGLGGTVTWPTTGQLDPGQTVLSNATPNGRHVLLTYISGPLGSSPSGSVRTQSGNQVFFHQNSTDGTAAPIRVRLDFIQ